MALAQHRRRPEVAAGGGAEAGDEGDRQKMVASQKVERKVVERHLRRPQGGAQGMLEHRRMLRRLQLQLQTRMRKRRMRWMSRRARLLREHAQ